MDAGVVEQGDLDHVLGQISRHLVDLSDLREPLEEGVAADEVDVEVQLLEHARLHFNYLLLIISFVADVDVVLDQWRPDLLVLASDQHGADTHELQVLFGHHHLFQVPVDQVDGQKQTLYLELELEVHLDDPVNEDAPHPFGDVRLLFHILRLGLVVVFDLEVVLHDGRSEFDHVLRVGCMPDVTFTDCPVHITMDPVQEIVPDVSHIGFKVQLLLLLALALQLGMLSLFHAGRRRRSGVGFALAVSGVSNLSLELQRHLAAGPPLAILLVVAARFS